MTTQQQNNTVIPRLDSNSDRLDRRNRLPLSHRVMFFIGSVLIKANRMHFILVCLHWCLTSQSTAMFVSKRFLHYIDVYTKLGYHGIQNVLQKY